MEATKKRANRGLAVVLASSLMVTSSTTHAGTWTGGASEWTQIANNIQLVLQYVQQIMMVVNLAKQVAMMVKMTAKANSPQEAFAVMSGMHQIFGTVGQIVFQGRSLTDQWKQSHPGLKTPDVPAQAGGQGYGSIEEAYDAIDKNLHAAAERSLKALDVHLDPNNVRQDEQLLEQLKNKAESAEGQMQATQATNALLLEVIRQLNLIRQVNVIQAQMVTLAASDEAQRRMYVSAVRQRDYAYRGLYRGNAAGATAGGVQVGAPLTTGMPAATPSAAGGGATGGLAPQSSGPLFQSNPGPLATQNTGPLAPQSSGPLAQQNTGSLAPQSSGPLVQQNSGSLAPQSSGPLSGGQQ